MNIKYLFTIIMALALLMGSANAIIYHPLPIVGKVSGLFIDNIEVQISNQRTGKIMITHTNGAGEFLVDWANSDDESGTILKYQHGDTFKIVLPACEDNPACFNLGIYNGIAPEIYVKFDLSGMVNICPDCPVCPELEECPELNLGDKGVEILIGFITALVVFIGGGIKIYRNKMGQASVQHRHKGIRGYHNVNTLHKDKRYAHRRWKDNPKGCIDDVKKIEDYGSMI